MRHFSDIERDNLERIITSEYDLSSGEYFKYKLIELLASQPGNFVIMFKEVSEVDENELLDLMNLLNGKKGLDDEIY